MSERIDAPKLVTESIQEAQREIDKINIHVKAMLFGAATALNVPNGWQWDGSGWVEPERNQVVKVDDTRG